MYYEERGVNSTFILIMIDTRFGKEGKVKVIVCDNYYEDDGSQAKKG